MEQKILDHTKVKYQKEQSLCTSHSKYYYDTERNLSNGQILKKRIKELKEKIKWLTKELDSLPKS